MVEEERRQAVIYGFGVTRTICNHGWKTAVFLVCFAPLSAATPQETSKMSREIKTRPCTWRAAIAASVFDNVQKRKKKKKKISLDPGLNRRPGELQSPALPLSYQDRIACWRIGLRDIKAAMATSSPSARSDGARAAVDLERHSKECQRIHDAVMVTLRYGRRRQHRMQLRCATENL